MIGLYITLGLMAFLIFILSIPVGVEMEYGEEFIIKLKYLFLKISLNTKEKKPKKDKPKKEKKKTKERKSKSKNSKTKKVNEKISFFEKLGANEGVEGALEFLKEITRILTKMFSSVAKHVIIKPLIINISVSQSDSAKTSVTHGKLCAIIFPCVESLDCLFNVKKRKIDIRPNFLAPKTLVYIKFSISIRPIFVVCAAVVAFFRYLKNILIKNRMVKK